MNSTLAFLCVILYIGNLVVARYRKDHRTDYGNAGEFEALHIAQIAQVTETERRMIRNKALLEAAWFVENTVQLHTGTRKNVAQYIRQMVQ